MKISLWTGWLVIPVLLTSLCQTGDASVFRRANHLNEDSHPNFTFKISTHNGNTWKLEDNFEVFREKRDVHPMEEKQHLPKFSVTTYKETELSGNNFVNKSTEGYQNTNSSQLDWKINVQISKRGPSYKLNPRIKSARQATLENENDFASGVKHLGDDVNVTMQTRENFLGVEVNVEGYGDRSSYDELWKAWNSVGHFLITMFENEKTGSNDQSSPENDEISLVQKADEWNSYIKNQYSDSVTSNLIPNDIDVLVERNEMFADYHDNSNGQYEIDHDLDFGLTGDEVPKDHLPIFWNITEEEFLPHKPGKRVKQQSDLEMDFPYFIRNLSFIQDGKSSSESSDVTQEISNKPMLTETLEFLNKSNPELRFFLGSFDRGSGAVGRSENENTAPPRQRSGKFILGFLGFGATSESSIDDIGEDSGSGRLAEQGIPNEMQHAYNAEFDSQENTPEEVKGLNMTKPRPRFYDEPFNVENEFGTRDGPNKNYTEFEKGRRLWNLFGFVGSGERLVSIDDGLTDTPSLGSLTGEFYEKLDEIDSSNESNFITDDLSNESPKYYKAEESTKTGKYLEPEMTSESLDPRFFNRIFDLGSGDGSFIQSNDGTESTLTRSTEYEENSQMLLDVQYEHENSSLNETLIGRFSFEGGSGDVTWFENGTNLGLRGGRLVDDYDCLYYDCYFDENVETPNESYDNETEPFVNEEVNRDFKFSTTSVELKLPEINFEDTTFPYINRIDPTTLKDKDFDEYIPKVDPSEQFRTPAISSSLSNDRKLTTLQLGESNPSKLSVFNSDLYYESTEISEADNTMSDFNSGKYDNLMTTQSLLNAMRSRKAKSFDEVDPEEIPTKYITPNIEFEATSTLAGNQFPLTSSSMSDHTMSTVTMESTISSLTEMTFASVTKHAPLPRSCHETWECDDISNERCVHGNSSSICGCGRSFIRHPLTGSCEVAAKIEATLRFPNEPFYDGLNDPSSKLFKEIKKNSIDTMALLVRGNPELSSTVAEFDLVGFKPGSLNIIWSLSIPTGDQDTMESIIRMVDEELRESLSDPALLRKLPFDIHDVALLKVRSSSVDPCQFPVLNYCHKNALCIQTNSTAVGFRCKCKEGYTDLSDNVFYPGEICKAHCFPGYCGEHGTCRITVKGTMECECTGWFVGERCKTSGVVLVAGASTAIVLICFVIFLAVIICKFRRYATYGNAISQRSRGIDNLGISGSGSHGVGDVLALEERNPLPSRFAYVENTPTVHTLATNVPQITVTSPSITVSDTSYDYSDSTFDSVKFQQ